MYGIKTLLILAVVTTGCFAKVSSTLDRGHSVSHRGKMTKKYYHEIKKGKAAKGKKRKASQLMQQRDLQKG